MWIKLTSEYISGIVAGAGLLLLLLALSAGSERLVADGLKGAGVKFAALAMVLAGGGIKLRAQSRRT